MDLIPLDQMSPRSVDTTAAEGGDTVRAFRRMYDTTGDLRVNKT